MKVNKPSLILLGGLMIIIGVSTVSSLVNNGTPSYVDGVDCLGFHDSTYVRTSEQLNYLGEAKPGEGLEFSILISRTTGGMIFNATVELYNFPDNLTLQEGSLTQVKTDMNADAFNVTWTIAGDFEGNFTFAIRSRVSVNFEWYHPTYVATYRYLYTGNFQVSDNPTEPPYLDQDIPKGEEPSIPLNIELLTGRLLGFLSVLFVYLSIQFGLPERKTKIRKFYKLTAAKCRDVHCDLGYLAVGTIVLHNIMLSRTVWGLYFSWFEFYPTFHVLRNGGNTLTWGLDLAVWGSLIFIIVTVAGVYFKKIARKFGFKTAVFLQQISYLALTLSVIHAILNGYWTQEFPILLILQIAMLADVVISRYMVYIRMYDKRLKKKQDLAKAQEQLMVQNSPDSGESSLEN
ncbi:MAG: hypothetical protein ACTSWW_01870 [Promethearchaeota archaeon]